MTDLPRRALVVEDDPAITLIVETILTTHGYRVTCVPSAAEALAAEPADVVLTDLNLEGSMDGIALSRMLRARNPQLAVVYISGAIDEDHVPDGVPGAAALGKPFRKAGLLATVTSALEGVSS